MAIRPRSYLTDFEKFCLHCSSLKPFSEFASNPRSLGGLQTYCRACQKERSKSWRSQNNDYRLSYAKNYRETHKEEIRLSNLRHRPIQKIATKRWKEENPTRSKAIAAMAFSRSRGPVDPSVDIDFFERLFQEPYCFYCERYVPVRDRTHDHYLPLVKGGLTTAANLVMSCWPCNSSKSTTPGDDFMLNFACSF